MATALFVTTTDVKRFTIVDGNVDNDKFIQFIEIAQTIYIQNILGTDLFEALQSKISGSTLTGDYETLVETWIKPCLIWYAFHEYLTWAGVTVGNKGVFKHTSEAAIVVEPAELNVLLDKAKSYADYYQGRLNDYLCANSGLFPEYVTNSNGDVAPSSDTSTINWYFE